MSIMNSMIANSAVNALFNAVRDLDAEGYGVGVTIPVDHLSRILGMPARFSMDFVRMLKEDSTVAFFADGGYDIEFHETVQPDPVFGGAEISFPAVSFLVRG
jgi:hypothetical protein